MDVHYKEKLLETELNKYQLLPYLRERVADIPIPFEKSSIEAEIAKDILAQLLFYKRTTPDVLVGLLYKRFPNTEVVLSVLDALIEQDYLDYTERHQIVTKFSLPQEEENKLQTLMYPLPLVVPPLPLKRNSDSGYWYAARTCLVLRSSFMKGDINLDHLNRVNAISFRINKEVLSNRKHTPKKELPTVQDRANWQKFVEQQEQVAKFYEDTPFYLTHKYDKRGRIYCQGYHISYQGDDFTKALVEFSEGEICI